MGSVGFVIDARRINTYQYICTVTCTHYGVTFCECCPDACWREGQRAGPDNGRPSAHMSRPPSSGISPVMARFGGPGLTCFTVRKLTTSLIKDENEESRNLDFSKDQSIRQSRVPKLKLSSPSHERMIDWRQRGNNEPPLTVKMTDEGTGAIIDMAVQVKTQASHTQGGGEEGSLASRQGGDWCGEQEMLLSEPGSQPDEGVQRQGTPRHACGLECSAGKFVDRCSEPL